MFRWFYKLIKKTQRIDEDRREQRELDRQPERDFKIVQIIINKLETDPGDFTSMWFGAEPNESIQNSKRNILIMDYGTIVHPKNLTVTTMQTEKILKLIEPIFRKDLEAHYDGFIENES